MLKIVVTVFPTNLSSLVDEISTASPLAHPHTSSEWSEVMLRSQHFSKQNCISISLGSAVHCIRHHRRTSRPPGRQSSLIYLILVFVLADSFTKNTKWDVGFGVFDSHVVALALF